MYTQPQTPCHPFNAFEKFNAIWETHPSSELGVLLAMPEGPKDGVQGIQALIHRREDSPPWVSVPCPTGAASQGAGGRPNLPGISSEYTRVQGELIWARCPPQVFGEVFQEIWRNHKKFETKEM